MPLFSKKPPPPPPPSSSAKKTKKKKKKKVKDKEGGGPTMRRSVVADLPPGVKIKNETPKKKKKKPRSASPAPTPPPKYDDTSVSSKKKFGSRVKGLFKGAVAKRKKRRKSESSAYSDNLDMEMMPPKPLNSIEQTAAMLDIAEDSDEDDSYAGGPRGLRSRTKQGNNKKATFSADTVDPSEGSANAGEDALSRHNQNAVVLVMLLVDPTSLRFELLQLEFDVTKAKVSDILAQIPKNVTEAALQNIVFSSIIDRNLQGQSGDTMLGDFCAHKELVVAIPEGRTVNEVARLAGPILSDERVTTMLKGNGFDVSSWTKDADKARTLLSRPKKVPPPPLFTKERVIKSVTALVLIPLISYSIYLLVNYFNSRERPMADIMENVTELFNNIQSQIPSLNDVFVGSDEEGDDGTNNGTSMFESAKQAVSDAVEKATVTSAATSSGGKSEEDLLFEILDE